MWNTSRPSLRPAGSLEAFVRARQPLPRSGRLISRYHAPTTLRPASADQPVGLRWPALSRLAFRHRPATDAEFSLSAERQLDPDEEDGRLAAARDEGTETLQRNWPKPFGNW